MDYSSFARTLVRFRRANGMTQRQLADASGHSPSAIESYEQGRRLPEAVAVSRLARALALEPEDENELRRAAGLGGVPSGFEAALLRARGSPDTVWDEVQDAPWVCLVLNERREFVAWNGLANRTSELDLASLSQFERSVLRMAATEHFDRHLRNWDELIGGHIAILKAEGVDGTGPLPPFVQAVLDSVAKEDPHFLDRIFRLFFAVEPWVDGRRNIHPVEWTLNDGTELSFAGAITDWSNYDGLWAFDWHATDGATAEWVRAQRDMVRRGPPQPPPLPLTGALLELRRRQGASRKDVAERAGFGQSTVAAYENGTRKPTRVALLSLCRVLNADGYATNRLLREAGFEEEPSDWARWMSGERPITIYREKSPVRPAGAPLIFAETDKLNFPSVVLDNACHVVHANPLAKRLVGFGAHRPLRGRPGPHLLQLMVSEQFQDAITTWEVVAGVFLPGRLEHIVLGAGPETSSSSLLALSRQLAPRHGRGLERLAAVWADSPGYASLRRPAVRVQWRTPGGDDLLFNCSAAGITPSDPYKALDFYPADAATFAWLGRG